MRYESLKNNKNDKYLKDYLKIKVSIIYALCKRKKEIYNSKLI